MKNAHTMLLNDEVLLKLQEAYALEIISLSELAIPVPTPRLLAGEIDDTDDMPANSSTRLSGASSSAHTSNGSITNSQVVTTKPPPRVISVPVGPLVNPHSIGASNTRSWLYR